MNLEEPLASLFGWHLLILALGIYSITRLITKDSIVDNLRERFFTHWPHEGLQTYTRPKRGQFIQVSGGGYYVNTGTKLGELIHCPWCSGWWVSLGLCLSYWAWPIATTAVLVPFALRVIPGMIEAWTD